MSVPPDNTVSAPRSTVADLFVRTTNVGRWIRSVRQVMGKPTRRDLPISNKRSWEPIIGTSPPHASSGCLLGPTCPPPPVTPDYLEKLLGWLYDETDAVASALLGFALSTQPDGSVCASGSGVDDLADRMGKVADWLDSVRGVMAEPMSPNLPISRIRDWEPMIGTSPPHASSGCKTGAGCPPPPVTADYLEKLLDWMHGEADSIVADLKSL